MSDPLKILFVDDDADIRTIVEMALALDSSIEVRAAGSAADALDQLAAWTPDVCLFDVMMPVIDGVSLLSQLRDAGFAVPIIFMTARARAQDLAVYREAGAAGVIAKPFDPLTLPVVIRQLLSRSDDQAR
jgi:DNA-binding response OmpR family regulator